MAKSNIYTVQPSTSSTERGRTDTGGCSVVGFVAHVTVTAEGSDGVDALAVLTQIGHHLALVDVWKYRDILENDLRRAPSLIKLLYDSVSSLCTCKKTIYLFLFICLNHVFYLQSSEYKSNWCLCGE